MKTYITLFFVFICISSYTQNIFTLGAKIGYGSSAFPMTASIQADGNVTDLKSGAVVSGGLVAGYMLTDFTGIEFGVSANDYSLHFENRFRARDAFWKTPSNVQILNIQSPIAVTHKFLLSNTRHSSYLTLGLGTSIDLFSTYSKDGYSFSFVPEFTKNLVSFVRMGREKARRKIEFGIETQYSLSPFKLKSFPQSMFEEEISSRLNMLTLNAYYFFVSK